MLFAQDPALCAREVVPGLEFVEISCLYPILKPFIFEWEMSYQCHLMWLWMLDNPWCPITAVVLYAVGIVAGRAYFKNRERLHWKNTLAMWNLGLSTFSAIGVFRTFPILFYLLTERPRVDMFCTDPVDLYGEGSVGLWVQLFCLSKFPELLDTFFIVINKKPLIFLHWYHHITVLLYCWHAYVKKAPHGIVFVVMNYAVHSMMYFYYFLMAVKMKPKWLNPMFITVLQISQMIVGVAVTLTGFYYSQTEPGCKLSFENNVAGCLMYGSYLFLFCQFFFGRYMIKQNKPKVA